LGTRLNADDSVGVGEGDGEVGGWSSGNSGFGSGSGNGGGDSGDEWELYPGGVRRKKLISLSHLELAEELMATCYQMYKAQPSGIAPESTYFRTASEYPAGGAPFGGHAHHHGEMTPVETKYILRPETVESLYVLYTVTGDRKYQDWGWEMWTAIEKHCKTKSGYSGIKDVTLQDLSKLEWNDSTQSFWMAETLKYFYLLFQVSGLLRNVTS
jgi:hypothetical protein